MFHPLRCSSLRRKEAGPQGPAKVQPGGERLLPPGMLDWAKHRRTRLSAGTLETLQTMYLRPSQASFVVVLARRHTETQSDLRAGSVGGCQ